MTRLELRHPEDGLLLQYLDGELSKRQSREIANHLEACWQCRVDLEDLRATVNDCVRYRKQVFLPALPEPPYAWGSLDFARVDAEIAAESIFSRLGRWLSPWQSVPLRWALSGAMVLVLSFAIFRQLRETPNVQAAVLLQKAVAAGESRAHTVKRLRITTRTRSLTRVTGSSMIRAARGEAEIARLFESAKYDWKDPLSAKAYAAWHEALIQKVDEVASADPSTYSIKTNTTGSELVRATLKLRKTDLEPIEGRFEFRNQEWVEMTELVDQLNPASTVAGAAGGTPRQPGVPPGPSSPHSAATMAPVSVNEELEVVAALHQLGADLGDPIEISREGRDIVVGGTGIAPQRQQQIHDALDRLPHVVVRFSDPSFPAGTPAQSEPATARDAAAAEKSTNTARMEQRLGGRPQFERFSGQLLDWTDSAMSRVYALRRLAQQFSPASEQAMSAKDRHTLRTLGREHVAALQKDLNQIQTALNPVLTEMGAAPVVREPIATSIPWQAATESLLASARRTETLLAAVLGITSGAVSSDAPAQLQSALEQLASHIEHCQRLLSYD
jgi:hypothetical protein